jgi:hypothetical protein
MKNKPKLAIAYYWNIHGEKDAEIYISLDDFSNDEFIKYFFESYDTKLSDEDIEGIYPVNDGYLMDIKGKKYDIIIKLKK